MALAETAKLVSSLELDTSKFTKGINSATGSMGKLSGAVAHSRAVAVGLGVGLEHLAEKGITSLADAIGNGITEVQLLEKANAQTAAAIKSTGGVAGVTAAQVRTLAQAEEDLTTADDKIVQQGENLLLTFRGIGKDVFPQATAAMVNMAIALNKGDAATADFDGSALRLGKALQDPLKGVTALQRVGVVFTAEQKKQIAANYSWTKSDLARYAQLQKSNKAEAARFKAQHDATAQQKGQLIILAELKKEFGDAGAAAGTGFTADVNRANDAIRDAEAAIATGLIPAIGEIAKTLTTTLRDPQVISGLKDLGTSLGGALKGAVEFAKTVPWGTIASSLQAAAGFAKDLLNAFLGLPTWVQTAVITGWGLNKLTGGALTSIVGSLASGLIKGVLGINAGVVNVNGAVVNGGGGLPGGGGGEAPGVLGAAAGIGLFGAASLGALGAVISKEAADLTNQQFGDAGFPVHFVGPGSSGDNPLLAALPFGVGGAIQDIAEFIRVGSHPASAPLATTTPGAATAASSSRQTEPFFVAAKDIAAAAAALKAAVAPKTPKQASAILKTGAAHDKDTSAAIRNAVTGPASNILKAAAARDKEASAAVKSAVGKLDAKASGILAAAAARASETSASIAGAIRAAAPKVTVNVDVSATSVTKKTTIVRRYGPTGGTRDTSARQNEGIS